MSKRAAKSERCQKRLWARGLQKANAAKSGYEREDCKKRTLPVTASEAWGAEKRGSEGRPLQQHRSGCQPSEAKDGGLLGHRVSSTAFSSAGYGFWIAAEVFETGCVNRIEAHRTGKHKRPIEERSVDKGQACAHAVAKCPNRLPRPAYESVLDVGGR